MASFYAFLKHGIPLKVNMVVMEASNTADIIPMALLSRDYPVDIRFYRRDAFLMAWMPVNKKLRWHHRQIHKLLREHFPSLTVLPSEPYSTSKTYQIDGHAGTVGIIAGFSRTFCGTCNRIRITAQGKLQTCLYGEGTHRSKRSAALRQIGSGDNGNY